MMAERGLTIDHSTIARWVLRYAPVLNARIRSEMRNPNRSWRVDETYIRVAGQWSYLYRAVDSAGNTIDFLLSPYRDLIAAKSFLQLAVAHAGRIQPRVINVDGHPAYPAAVADLKQSVFTYSGESCHAVSGRYGLSGNYADSGPSGRSFRKPRLSSGTLIDAQQQDQNWRQAVVHHRYHWWNRRWLSSTGLAVQRGH
jgi:hypothetical protein